MNIAAADAVVVVVVVIIIIIIIIIVTNFIIFTLKPCIPCIFGYKMYTAVQLNALALF